MPLSDANWIWQGNDDEKYRLDNFGHRTWRAGLAAAGDGREATAGNTGALRNRAGHGRPWLTAIKQAGPNMASVRRVARASFGHDANPDR